MRYLALAIDFDGTLARYSRVAQKTVAAVKELRKSGRKAILVTGRVVASLEQAFHDLDVFDAIVAENGAVLYDAQKRRSTLLAAAPPPEFAHALAQRGVTPLETGEVIVATWEPHQNLVMQTIRDMGLELQILFNKGAVMALPSGVNKATGLAAALRHLEISPRSTAAAGDAENDHAMMQLCELSAAVANALPSVKDEADIVLTHGHGEGVTELIAMLIQDDCAAVKPQPRRGPIILGSSAAGTVTLPPYLPGITLVAGESGSGKSSLTTGIVERIADRGYQLCLIDPEGDYDAASFAVSIGDPKHVPSFDEIETQLREPSRTVAVNLLGLQTDARPEYFAALMPRLAALRAKTGRPHWIVLDEAHHLLPKSQDTQNVLPEEITNTIAVTVRPSLLAQSAIERVRHVIAVGENARDAVKEVEPRTGSLIPKLTHGQAAFWRRGVNESATVLEVEQPAQSLARHRRKYATGEPAPEKSFYFRGKDGRLNLRAQNLTMFVQLAQGLDDETWMHHLNNGDVERWFQEMIGDGELARAASLAAGKGPQDSRESIAQEIQKRYTAPA